MVSIGWRLQLEGGLLTEAWSEHSTHIDEDINSALDISLHERLSAIAPSLSDACTLAPVRARALAHMDVHARKAHTHTVRE
jgi:hypothetical protein